MILGTQAADSLSPYAGFVSEKELKEQSDFLDTLEKLDAYLESQRKTEWEKRREEQERLAKKDKEKRIQELRLRIRTLESRILSGIGDMAASYTEKELAALKGELFMLMLFA